MKKINNKAFSLVELIIVVAILAVLVGVLAPQYMKYVTKTQKTRDCSTINTILDACEVVALDPDTTWISGTAGKVTIVISDSGATYSGSAASQLTEYVSGNNASLVADDWGPFTITAIRADNGRVTFDIDDADKTALGKYSSVLSERLE